MDQQELKVEIKRWEHEFREKEGRNPQKEDIKKDASIGEYLREEAVRGKMKPNY